MNRPGGPMRPGSQKAKNFKQSMGKLIGYLEPHLVIVVFALLCSVIGCICSLKGPKKLGEITTLCQIAIMQGESIPLDQIRNIGFTLIGLYLTSIILSYLCGFLMTGVSQKIANKLRSEISEKINKLPLKYFDSRSYGDVLSRVSNDVDNISQNLNQSLTQIISSITMLVGVIVMMISISVQLTAIAFITIPVSMICMMFIVKFSQKQFRAQQSVLGQLNGHIEESYSGHTIIKVFNQESENLEKFEEYNANLKKSAWKSQFLSGMMMPIMGFIGNLSYIAVCIFGGSLAVGTTNRKIRLDFWKDGFKFFTAGSRLMIGDLQGFIQYTRQFNQPLQQIAQITNILQSCAAASERVFEFLAEQEMPSEKPSVVLNKEDVKGYVEFKDVNFGYNPDKQIIFDFNCLVKPGQKVAIVGPTGAGKTTIVNLLMRFYEVNSGTILIDNIPSTDMSRENVAGLFGMVLQDTWLYEGTILDNLRYGNKNATKEEVIEACKACHVDHFIKSLPDGFNYMLEENANISQGQKQLMTIARAMIQNAPMLILDEATSSVDTRTEVLIQKAMDELMKGRTSFVIAHRLSTIKNADVILVMKNGNIIEKGNHDELIKQNGFYCDLYNSQFSEN